MTNPPPRASHQWHTVRTPGGHTALRGSIRRQSERVYRRRRLTVFGVGGLLIVAVLYAVLTGVGPARAREGLMSPGTGVLSGSPAAIAWPSQGSAIVGLLDPAVVPGAPAVLGQFGGDKPIAIASMTKTITALMMLKKYPLSGDDEGPTITFTQNDVKILQQVWAEDGSWANVQAGEQLTLRQALTAMLLPSANNYAISLAEWAYGSESNYLSAVNSWLASSGFKATKITDPAGLDPGTVSDLNDLIGIARLVERNPVLAGIVAQKQATLPTVGTVTNTNNALDTDGIDGIKTGSTDQAGYCLMFSATATIFGTPQKIVGVIAGQSGWDALWSQVPKIIDSVKAGFHTTTPTTNADNKHTVYGTATTAWGATTTIVAQRSPALQLWSATSIAVSVRLQPVGVGPAGSVAGSVVFTVAGHTTTVPLVTSSAISAPSYFWRLTHPSELY